MGVWRAPSASESAAGRAAAKRVRRARQWQVLGADEECGLTPYQDDVAEGDVVHYNRHNEQNQTGQS